MDVRGGMRGQKSSKIVGHHIWMIPMRKYYLQFYVSDPDHPLFVKLQINLYLKIMGDFFGDCLLSTPLNDLFH